MRIGTRRRTQILAVVVFAGVCSVVEPARAQEFTPTDAATLAAALETANTNAQPDKVHLGGRTFVLSGTLDVMADGGNQLTLQGPGTLKGDGILSAFRVLDIDAGAVVVLDQVTITDGREEEGAGIRNAGTTAVDSSTISGNTATGAGGAIYNTAQATLHVTSSTISDNEAHDGADSGAGGAIFNHGRLDITSTSISDNSTRHFGGGIFNSDTGTATITSSTISGNAADHGGGIRNFGVLALTDSTISANVARGEGGGILLLGTSTTTIRTSTIARNRAGFEGGGLSIAAPTEITSSTISGNTTSLDGGGIYHAAASIITSSTIAGNSASRRGGGMYNDFAQPRMTASIVGSNSASTGPDCTSDGPSSSIASGGFNVVSDDTGCMGFVASDRFDTDAQLGPLDDNGGPTQTHAITSSSPAFELHSASDPSCTGTDQRGVVRPQFTHCDAGAFELEQRTGSGGGSSGPAGPPAPSGPTGPDAPADLTPPDTAITSGPDRSRALGATSVSQTLRSDHPRTRDRTPSFSFTSDDLLATFQCAIDDGSFVPCSSPYTVLEALIRAEHRFAVRAIDAAGNIDETPASIEFRVRRKRTKGVDRIRAGGRCVLQGIRVPCFDALFGIAPPGF